MKKNFILVLSILISHLSYSQIGINTQAPKATLDVVDLKSTYRPLKISPIGNNVTKKSPDIHYTQGLPLYIDDNGYVFAGFSPVLDNGVIMPFDIGKATLSTTWTTLYKLPHRASVAEFSFFTNLSLGGEEVNASANGRLSVGYNSMINLYAYNTTIEIGTVTGNLTKSVAIKFATGSNLEFQLTGGNEIQARLSVASDTNSEITIYNSSVTRVK